MPQDLSNSWCCLGSKIREPVPQPVYTGRLVQRNGREKEEGRIGGAQDSCRRWSLRTWARPTSRRRGAGGTDEAPDAVAIARGHPSPVHGRGLPHAEPRAAGEDGPLDPRPRTTTLPQPGSTPSPSGVLYGPYPRVRPCGYKLTRLPCNTQVLHNWTK